MPNGSNVGCKSNYLERLSFCSCRDVVGCCSAISHNGGISVPIDWMTPTPKEDTVIGNILWPRDVVEKVGAWDERLDPHGPVDLDYCNRANKAGYKNWYLPNMMANHHWGHDGNLYGYDKQAVIKEKWDLYCHTVGDPNFYIPFDDMSKYYEQ